MVDVLFTHSYFLRFDPKQWEAGRPFPPLATLYAAAYLRSRGLRVALHDVQLLEHEDTLGAALERHDPRVLVVYDDGFNYLTKMCLSRMREAALAMLEVGRKRGLRTVVSSSDATDCSEMYLSSGAEFVIVGEGEQTLGELADVLLGRSGAAPADIPGLRFLGPDGIERTPPRPLLKDLDELPLPAWDLVDIESYRQHWLARHGHFHLNVSTTRGCPYKCNWCAKPIYGNRYTVRSPSSVADEWAMLKRQFAPDRLWVCDDIFGLKPGWVESFATELASRGGVVPFQIQARVDLMTESTVAALARSGCALAWVGAESGAQSILDAMDKGTRVEQIRDATDSLHAAGIGVAFFLQFGYPGETWENIESTLEMVRRLKPDDIGISVSYPLPGTAFYDHVQNQMGKKTNWKDSDDLDPMYPSPYRPEFYKVLHRRVHAEFRMRQAIKKGVRGRSMLRAAKYAARWAWLELRLRRGRQQAGRARGTVQGSVTTESTVQ